MLFRRGIVVVALACFMAAVPAQVQAGQPNEVKDPWLERPVLPYLLLTVDQRMELETWALSSSLGLTEQEEAALLELAYAQQEEMRALFMESEAVLRDAHPSEAVRQEAVGRHNAAVTEAIDATDAEVRGLLGERYPAFRDWVRAWWSREVDTVTKLKQPQQENGVKADTTYCWMFATQYNGYTNYEIALPDQYIKFANLGWGIPYPYNTRYTNPKYTATINRDSYWVYNVEIKEVGPWNINDNYWDSATGSNPRRLGSDIPICWSEAEYAYYNGYNGGKDEYGRTVTVPTSVDLTPAVAADLGLAYLQNSNLYVYYSDLP